MFLFTGPTPKLLNSCGANVVDLTACGHPTEHLAHKHTLRPRTHASRGHPCTLPPLPSLTHHCLWDELASPPPAFDLLSVYFPHVSEWQSRLGLRPLSPALFTELSGLRPQICFFSHIFIKCHSKLTKSQNPSPLCEKTVRNRL